MGVGSKQRRGNIKSVERGENCGDGGGKIGAYQ